jgi:hypothetical protein
MKLVIRFAALLLVLTCSGSVWSQAPASTKIRKPQMSDTIRANIYADNAFMLYINGDLVAVDSIAFVPHNVISVDILPSYPMTIAVMARDNFDAKTGMEYANTNIGDGGFVLKFGDGTVTNSDWKAKRISWGPIDHDTKNPRVESIPVPENWYAVDFDDSTWDKAKEYTEEEVGPKQPYFENDFAGAKFIWSNDIALDNVVLFRHHVKASPDGKERLNFRELNNVVPENSRREPRRGRATPTGSEQNSEKANVRPLGAGVDDDTHSVIAPTSERISLRQTRVVQNGFVFVDGQYLSPPYKIWEVGDQLFINDTELSPGSFPHREATNARGGITMSDESRIVQQLLSILRRDGVHVFFTGRPVASYCPAYPLFRVLVREEFRSEFVNGERDWLLPGTDEHQWVTWVRNFQCPSDFLQRASVILDEDNRLTASTEAKRTAELVLDRSAYPLTMLGMILVTLSFGFLLNVKPNLTTQNLELLSPDSRTLWRALLLLVSLSAIDLIWTLLVSQAGAMRELNPIGSVFIRSPAALLAFKVVATGTAIVILGLLRRRPIAHRVAWWGCLVYTLVIVRWLTFNSMFIS